MSVFDMLKPLFLGRSAAASIRPEDRLDYRRIWQTAVALTAAVSLMPLVFITLLDYQVTQRSIESEITLRTSRLVSNTQRRIAFFINERKAALDFVARDNDIDTLKDTDRLAGILANLTGAFGGFTDFGLIDPEGIQIAYVGPHSLTGKNYSRQSWYRQAVETGVFISEVFLGYRNQPHIVIAVKHQTPDGNAYLLRASLDTTAFNSLLKDLEIAGQGDAFIIDVDGILQTPSATQGDVLRQVDFDIPPYSPKTSVYELENAGGEPMLIGYRYITGTRFILMIMKNKAELMRPWMKTRRELILFLAISCTTIILVIMGGITYLVNRIYLADVKRLEAFRRMETEQKLSSIGRLAAGVAHEINNPLAIINEKAGLLKDLFAYGGGKTPDISRLTGLADSILNAVDRGARVTRRLLGFARQVNTHHQTIQLQELLNETTDFFRKEAEYRNVSIAIDVPEPFPSFDSDRGKVQQILLNLINNAFAAMNGGGRLEISARRLSDQTFEMAVADTGCGIPPEHLSCVFEPFFTSRAGEGGTGLGLSITYGLVRELGGDIHVESTVGQGTRFVVTLPFESEQKENSTCEYS
ncbi:MAG: sensor histidine kinase [Desulfobacterales bacterium]